MKRLSYIGVVQNNKDTKKQEESINDKIDLTQSELHKLSPAIIFTIPKADFMHIQNMVRIKCNIEDAFLFNVPGFIHSIKKINGKHQMYLVTLHVKDEYATLIKPGMFVEVNIYHIENNIEILKDRA